MSSLYDAVYEKFLEETFDMNAASTDTDLAESDFSYEKLLGDDLLEGHMQNDNVFFEMPSEEVSSRSDESNEHDAERAHGLDDYYGPESTLSGSAMLTDNVEATNGSPPCTQDFGQNEVGFFFKSTLTGRQE